MKVCVNNLTVDQLEPFTFNTTGDAYKTHVMAIVKPSLKCKEGLIPRNIVYEYFQRRIKIEGLAYQRVCKAKMEVALGNVSLYSIRAET
ncbi:unnamed protein product [Allacma fusca]|uniref:Uncharacterized protein n=1 Tax=Allacma fusca TaxID=39272 RepID=A0A8J2LGF6_9HEXA|nr:unnamed protein product [Allacma fusca]